MVCYIRRKSTRMKESSDNRLALRISLGIMVGAMLGGIAALLFKEPALGISVGVGLGMAGAALSSLKK